ncbi:MAG: LPS export ABC transporter periplasmic protein LptC [Spirochaetales bacterium]|nr:LPS export ABC transporter periplasmic protein LptC [Spirochaetales bacterium]
MPLPLRSAVRRGILPRIAGLGLILASAACSLDYGAEAPDELGPGTPELLLSGVRHRSISDGMVVFRVEAERAEIHESRGYTVLFDARFVEYAEDGSVATEGRADRIRIDTATEDAEIEGNVVFTSAREKASFATARLAWNAAERKLSGGDDALVTVRTEDGTELRGAGFEADAARGTFLFGEDVVGSFTPPEPEGEP